MMKSLHELEKLYAVKVPIFKHAEYYLETLMRSPQYSQLERWLDMGESLEREVEDISHYKMQMMDAILSKLKDTNGKDFLKVLAEDSEIVKFDFQRKAFNPENGKTYVSFDIREANWTAFRAMTGYPKGPGEYYLDKDFSVFLKEDFGCHPFVAESKTFRQLVFGNTQPKKLVRWQEWKISQMLKNFENFDVVGVSTDEIVVATDGKDVKEILELGNVPSVKSKVFAVNFVENYGETVRIDTTEGVKKLVSVPGNRFFMHFKSLILGEELDERDLLFRLEGFEARWKLPVEENAEWNI